MKQWIKDTAGLGIAFWFAGYLASLALFFTPYAGIMGWILLAVFTPVTVAIAWWWFKKRERLDLQVLRGCGSCLGADCRSARLPVYRADVPGFLLRN